MEKNTEYNKSEKWVFVLTMAYYVLTHISGLLPGGQLISLIPAIAIMLISVISSKGVIKLSGMGIVIYIVVFTAFCALSRLWAENPSLVIPKVNSMLICVLTTTIFAAFLGSQNKTVDIMLKAIMYGGCIVCLFLISRFGLSGIISLIRNTSRISNEYLNANTVGMCAAYALVIDFHYIQYRKFKASDILMLPAIVMLFASVSRKAFIIIIFGFLGVLVLKNTKSKNILKNIGRVLLIIILVISLVFLLSKLPVFASIKQRMMNLISLLQGNETRYTSNAWIRLAYNRLGMQVFSKHPILGIGIANSNLYAKAYYGNNAYFHNNYVELLACGGIVGFLIYYSIWFSILMTFMKFRKFRDSEFDICLVLLVLRIIMDYGAVSYYSKETYFFLMLFCFEAKRKRSIRKTSPFESGTNNLTGTLYNGGV